MLYLISISVMFALGGVFAMLIRLELLTPAGDLFNSDTYNKIFTMHGVTMIFFFLIPSIPATLGNFLVPMMIGAKDLAFPRINLLSWYIYIVGALFALAAIVMGGVDTGWTFYTPFSTTYSNTFVITAAVGVFISGFSSITTGLNFIVTVHKMRAPGMTWGRLPLFVWANYATSLIQVLGTPVVAITLALVGLERAFHIGIFDPAIGGDPILFQHMFWFYSHPAVYIMILPGMGVISELVTCFSRKGVFGYSFIAGSSLGIAIIGFLVWGHHMFVTGMSMYAGTVLLAADDAGRGSFGHQGFQLDRDHVPRLHQLRNADAVRFRLYRPVHHRRPHWPVPGNAGTGRASHRHLLRGGALPLRDGGRHGGGVPRRPALLVAQDHRQNVSGRLGQVLRPAGVRRIQPDLLPAVHRWLSGPAAPLSRLCAGVPGAERDVDGGRFGAGLSVS